MRKRHLGTHFSLFADRHLQPPGGFRRRAFLGGAGVALGLPLLESLAPRAVRQAHAREPDQALRLVNFYTPCGMWMDAFTPTETGPGYTPTSALASLFAPEYEGLDQHVLVLSGLDNSPGDSDGPGDHASGTGSFLTCYHVNKSETDIQNGISMDQVYANHLADATSFSSLQLGIEGGSSVGNCDSGYSCAYVRNISWGAANNPLSKLTAPGLAFDVLFGGVDPEATAEEVARRRAYKLSILDYVQDDAAALQSKLGQTDRIKLEEYLYGVRELEMRIEAETDGPVCDSGNYSSTFADRPGHVKVMLDLIVLALSCDATRVASFMLANGASGYVHSHINGVNGSHHDLSHHASDPAKINQLMLIDAWEVAQFAYLLDRMRAVTEGESNLLENSLVFFSSEIEDGNAHRHVDLPILLGGSACGQIINGQHLNFDNGKVSELFITMLQSLGVDINAFGDDGAGPLAGITV